MNYINKFLDNPDIFNSNNKSQQLLFKQTLSDLTNYHKKNCMEYSNFVKKINFKRKISINFTAYLFTSSNF